MLLGNLTLTSFGSLKHRYKDKKIDVFDDLYILNTFKSDVVFKLFKNINIIEIITTGQYGWEYKLSFRYLSRIITKSSSLKKLVIKAVRKDSEYRREGIDSWLCSSWKSLDKQSLLMSIFAKQQFKVYFKTLETTNDSLMSVIEECIIIEKE